MNSFALQMNYKFSPVTLLHIFVFIAFFIIRDTSQFHDKRSRPAKVIHVDNSNKAAKVRRTIL